DWLARNETIAVLDAVTGSVLDTRTVADFSQGKYVMWNISGHVAFRITKNGDSNVVVAGIFFDPANVPGNIAPTVTLNNPIGAPWTAPATVSLSAAASDLDGTISAVRFYDGATLIGTSVDTTSPYTFNWTNVAGGTQNITQRAI